MAPCYFSFFGLTSWIIHCIKYNANVVFLFLKAIKKHVVRLSLAQTIKDHIDRDLLYNLPLKSLWYPNHLRPFVWYQQCKSRRCWEVKLSPRRVSKDTL